jgi:hypothetical protein
VPEPADQPEIHPALAEALRADRESLNQRFAQRQHAGARIDEAAFGKHLQTTVNELIGAVARVRPERARAVLNVLFDVSLDLFAAGLMGPSEKHPHVSAAWHEVLPQAAQLLAAEPTRVAGSLSNAAEHLAAHPAARPLEWIDGMRKLASHCDGVAQWLDVGKVLAWRAGLVLYRSAALVLSRTLPWKLAARCFDTPDDVTEADWYKRLDRAEADRWFSLVTGDAATAGRGLRIVRTTGGFRGFGGPCQRRPTAVTEGGRLFIAAGNDTYQLLADAFGTLWQRVAACSPRSTASNAVSINAGGEVIWDGTRQQFAELTDASSFACDGQTLAVTLPTSYHVFLVARAAP